MGSAGDPGDVAATWGLRAGIGLGLLAPLACGLAFPGTWAWLGAGALGWLVTVVGLKAPLAWALDRATTWLGPRVRGGLQGLLSGATELSAVPATLWWLGAPPSLAALLALGLGAAALEAVVVGASSGLEQLDPAYQAPPPPARTAWWLAFAFPIERWLVAAPGHVGSRGLVAASCLGAGWGPGLVALLAFAIVDGLPTAAESLGVSWEDPGVLGRYYAIAGGLGWLELGLAVYALTSL